MEVQNSSSLSSSKEEVEVELRRGPWTVEEDVVLINYIEKHGEGQWNSLARRSGLKRTGKSCRLRWLNYLRPDVRRGNITPEEQLLILELHLRYGNRWSKIAQHLPGRTDNEIKNYWRTRVQKHAKRLQCDVNSAKFKDVIRCLWMPQLMERIRVTSGICPTLSANVTNLPVFPNGQLGRAGMSPVSSNSNSVVTTSQVSSSFVQNPEGYCNQGLFDLEQWDMYMGGNLWNVEDIWF